MLKDKFDKFFDENGVQKKWVAKKLGMSSNSFYQIIAGFTPLPMEHWSKLIGLTRGEITLYDIMKEKFKNVEGVTVKKGEAPQECIISLTYVNKDSKNE